MMQGTSVRESSIYLFVIFFSLLFSSCSPGDSKLYPEPPPVSTIQGNYEVETQAAPTVALENPRETDHHMKTSTIGNTPAADIKINSIPLGEYLLYFDWISESLYLLSRNENEPDQAVANHWGNFSPDTEHFAFIKENTILTLIELDGDSVTQFPLDMSCYNDPSWSKKGDHLAIECEDNIYVYSLKGNSLIRLTSWGQRYVDSFSSPIWSPDGSRIAYIYHNLSSLSSVPENGIYVTDAECLSAPDACRGNTEGPFFSYAVGGIFSWSPDSRKLAFSEDLHSIRIVDLSTDEERLVLDNLDGIDGLVWSPDGECMAFSTRGNIYTVSLDGGEPELIAEDKGYIVAWVKNPAE